MQMKQPQARFAVHDNNYISVSTLQVSVSNLQLAEYARNLDGSVQWLVSLPRGSIISATSATGQFIIIMINIPSMQCNAAVHEKQEIRKEWHLDALVALLLFDHPEGLSNVFSFKMKFVSSMSLSHDLSASNVLNELETGQKPSLKIGCVGKQSYLF